MSKGLTRSRTDRLKVMQGGQGVADRASSPSPQGERVGLRGRRPQRSPRWPHPVRAREFSGTAALKAEPEQKLSPTELLEQHNRTDARAHARAAARKARRSARQGLRRRSLRRMREFHPGAERHVHEVRHVRVDDGVFVTTLRAATPPHLKHQIACLEYFHANSFLLMAKR